MSNDLTICNPKIHEHTLTLIRRENTFTCDACGVGWSKDGVGRMDMYACLQCNFMVQKDCIYLPRAIKITRHSHRLSHTFRIPDGIMMSCGVCQLKVNVGYGGYVCTKKTCDYVVHSICATNSYVWDGKDVETEPEEEEVISISEDIATLEEIDGNTIRYFSHDHNLTRLLIEGEKVCEACIRPIEFGAFLGCKQCDFSIHEACARLPRKMDHALHRHSLILHTNTMETKEGFFTCSVCNQESCGFRYQCSQEDCEFKIDLTCASFAEPFSHTIHSHPLFVREFLQQPMYECKGCNQNSRIVAWCASCSYNFDFKCVSLPGMVRYKCDNHPLTLYRDEYFWMFGLVEKRYVWQPYSWCQICEETINEKKFFYICHDCNTTLHVECIIGKHPYLKPGHRIKVNGFKVEIASNNGVSRPTCHACQHICQDKLVFNGRDGRFCSMKCISSTKALLTSS